MTWSTPLHGHGVWPQRCLGAKDPNTRGGSLARPICRCPHVFGFPAAYRGVSSPAREGVLKVPYHGNIVTRRSHRGYCRVSCPRPAAMAVVAPGCLTSPKRRPVREHPTAREQGGAGGRALSIPIPRPLHLLNIRACFSPRQDKKCGQSPPENPS